LIYYHAISAKFLKNQDIYDISILPGFRCLRKIVRGLNSFILLLNPERRFWSINIIKPPEVNIQLGRLDSGNIVEGQS